nr:MAG TPA: hypothetical protein [Caudoviricetes sp.]
MEIIGHAKHNWTHPCTHLQNIGTTSVMGYCNQCVQLFIINKKIKNRSIYIHVKNANTRIYIYGLIIGHNWTQQPLSPVIPRVCSRVQLVLSRF